uniref:Immunoglobulin V-set domain-containing protein n=1 Tax=Kryptolebias marmoratus TaxID=37003 RepID=A0A3Q3B7A4_KRYMA
FWQILVWDTFDLMKLDYVPSQTAHIACKYSDRWKSGTKVLCKETRPFVCKEIINTTQEAVGRFHIKDNKETNSFSVDIKNLTEADSGIYWCLSGKNEFVATELSEASHCRKESLAVGRFLKSKKNNMT